MRRRPPPRAARRGGAAWRASATARGARCRRQVQAPAPPSAPPAARRPARGRSGLRAQGSARRRCRSHRRAPPTRPAATRAAASTSCRQGTTVSMQTPERVPLPRWVAPVLLIAAAGLGPWTLWLTYSLPSRHLTRHYDLAWVVFDVALLCGFAVTGWCAVRASQWLVPAAAATGTMLLCDAWFDIITSAGGGERL